MLFVCVSGGVLNCADFLCTFLQTYTKYLFYASLI